MENKKVNKILPKIKRNVGFCLNEFLIFSKANFGVLCNTTLGRYFDVCGLRFDALVVTIEFFKVTWVKHTFKTGFIDVIQIISSNKY